MEVELLRIYLDQNKWIDLSKARFGREPEAAKLREVLSLAQTGVELGIVSFPLSHFHYIEQTHPDPGRRWRLATFMAELSRFHTIAPARLLLETEIDSALQARFGAPEDFRDHPVFGLGFSHACGEHDLEIWKRIRERIRTPEDWLACEKLILGRPPLDGKGDPSLRGEASRQVANNYRDAQRRLSAEFEKMHVERGHMRDILTGLEVIDLLDPLLLATRRAGLPDGILRRSDKPEKDTDRVRTGSPH
jgi:hypothetical protein